MSTVIALSDLAKDSTVLDQGTITPLLAAFAGLVLIGAFYDLITQVGKAFVHAVRIVAAVALGASALLTVMVVLAVVVVRA
ncbi:hypothetical protein [Asanoa iriomotensis]|uniref:Uncharacterized protein n=1 Tax=Asanoa iriomotensis TaxID=234613 RepID=A0ABQ4C4G4_9ACTN|nr:hypothetical protein [Asanoa iriomotensis]GIF57654.1 hypothetical protein Air01nite_37490 [Asanoa iriomotensis]